MKDTNTGYHNSGDHNSGDRNSGNCNSGDYNSGDYNSGDCNSGYRNSGYRNSGKCNSGYYNSGNYNSGNCNSGDYNSGDYNSGDYNSGDYNSGKCNSGNYNSGKCNSGYYNSGNYNSGDYNSGNYNSGNCNSGIFNTDEPFMRSFNKETTIKLSEFSMPSYEHFNVSYWIEESNMTEKEKKENPTYKTTGGYLKEVEYKEAWSIFWRRTSEYNKKKFLALPNFDAGIFKEITGIDIEQEDDVDVTQIAESYLSLQAQLEESERKLKIAVEALGRDRSNAAYDAGKADTNHDRDRFEHIRKSAQSALSAINPTP